MMGSGPPPSYSLSLEDRRTYLHARVAGRNTPANVRAYLREIYRASAQAGIPSVLIEEDLRGPALEPVEVYRLIIEASPETSPVLLKIAYVDVSGRDHPRNVRLGEAVARDRGVNVSAFSTIQEAQDWLVAQDGP
jgi:hypothetical protein